MADYTSSNFPNKEYPPGTRISVEHTDGTSYDGTVTRQEGDTLYYRRDNEQQEQAVPADAEVSRR